MPADGNKGIHLGGSVLSADAVVGQYQRAGAGGQSIPFPVRTVSRQGRIIDRAADVNAKSALKGLGSHPDKNGLPVALRGADILPGLRRRKKDFQFFNF